MILVINFSNWVNVGIIVCFDGQIADQSSLTHSIIRYKEGL